MEAVNPELKPVSQEVRVLRNTLLQRYDEIEGKAITAIQEGRVVSNPLLTGEKKDTRYALSVVGFLGGSVDAYLKDAAYKLQTAEPNIRVTQEGFRHVTFGEVYFNSEGRKKSPITAETARQYYNAISEKFIEEQNPVSIELFRIFPTLDREQSSLSVVAAFLPKGDLEIYRLREKITQAIEDKGLPFVGRLGTIPVIFATLGRFPYPPKSIQGYDPFLDELSEINRSLPKDKTFEISKIDLLSTTDISYMWTDKHVYMSPSISLKGNAQKENPRFITARKRKNLNE